VRVLVVGSGGREHALVRTLLRSPQSPEVLCAPGNAGIRRDARPLDAPDGDPGALARAARDAGVDLVVVGPEAPLVAGLADALAAAGVRCFGPRAAAARLEGSKAFAKEVMQAAGVPTAAHRVVETVEAGLTAIAGYPAVIKADGLAAGKGVVIAAGEDEARAALEDMLVARRFGDQPVVVEEFLAGEELSLLALCDGERAVPLAPARDYKRIGDGDTGPNTGGMGSYSPVAGADELVSEVIASVHQPVVEELARRGTPFAGTLYCGLALTSRGVRVVEFNARFGDPETQVVLPLLETPLGGLLHAAATGTLADHPPLRWRDGAAVTVVVAAPGYPEAPRTGSPVTGADGDGVLHAGTALGPDGRVLSAGGRVLSVVGLGADLAAARQAAYERVAAVRLADAHWRTDIALAAVEGRITAG
jgi:phosphoribosylamine--glycine ligase